MRLDVSGCSNIAQRRLQWPLRGRCSGRDGAGHDGDMVVGAAVGCCLHGLPVEAAEGVVGVAVLVLFLILILFLLIVRERTHDNKAVEEEAHRENLGEYGRHNRRLEQLIKRER